MKQKSLPVPRLRLCQLLGKHLNEAADPGSLMHLFFTHAHAHPQPQERFHTCWGDGSPWVCTLQMPSSNRYWLWVRCGFTAAFLSHFPVYTGYIYHFVGCDCGFLDLVKKKKKKPDNCICCVGEPKLPLQGLEKNVAFNRGCLITLGQDYSSTWRESALQIKFFVDTIFLKIPLFATEIVNSQC